MRSGLLAVLFCLVFAWVVLSRADVGFAQSSRSSQTGKNRMVSYGFGQNSFNFVRYNASTGETFYGKGENLVKYTDDVPPPAGDYEVQVVVQNSTTVPVRLETISGRVWYASGGKWIEMKVAPPAPQPK